MLRRSVITSYLKPTSDSVGSQRDVRHIGANVSGPALEDFRART